MRDKQSTTGLICSLQAGKGTSCWCFPAVVIEYRFNDPQFYVLDDCHLSTQVDLRLLIRFV